MEWTYCSSCENLIKREEYKLKEGYCQSLWREKTGNVAAHTDLHKTVQLPTVIIILINWLTVYSTKWQAGEKYLLQIPRLQSGAFKFLIFFFTMVKKHRRIQITTLWKSIFQKMEPTNVTW